MNLTADITLGTKNMLDKGLMARVTVNVHPEKGESPIFEINNILIRKSKDGDELWVAMPAEPFKVNTEEGEKTRWKAIVKVGPKEGKRGGETPTPIQDKFTTFVLGEYRKKLDEGKQNQTAQEPAPAAAPADQGEPQF